MRLLAIRRRHSGKSLKIRWPARPGSSGSGASLPSSTAGARKSTNRTHFGEYFAHLSRESRFDLHSSDFARQCSAPFKFKK